MCYKNSDGAEIVEGWAWGKIIRAMQLGHILDPEKWTGFGKAERDGGGNSVWNRIEKLVHGMTKERGKKAYDMKPIL